MASLTRTAAALIENAAPLAATVFASRIISWLMNSSFLARSRAGETVPEGAEMAAQPDQFLVDVALREQRGKRGNQPLLIHRSRQQLLHAGGDRVALPLRRLRGLRLDHLHLALHLGQQAAQVVPRSRCHRGGQAASNCANASSSGPVQSLHTCSTNRSRRSSRNPPTASRLPSVTGPPPATSGQFAQRGQVGARGSRVHAYPHTVGEIGHRQCHLHPPAAYALWSPAPASVAPNSP